MKLKRSALAHHLNCKGKSTPAWYLIGKDIDDMSVDMGGSFETKTNILDETAVSDTGYQPSIAVTPYYADPSDEIYPFLSDLALNRKSGDAAAAEYMETIVEDTEATSHKAWKEDCRIEITSYGGGTDGVTIEYTIHPNGNRVEGTVTFDASKKPTFSPKGAGLSD